MDQQLILFPILALVLLTFGIGAVLLKLRFSAVIKGKISAKYFKLYRGEDVPDSLLKVSHNFSNLLEIPVLFYVICILLLVTNKVELAQLILAWIFVGSRYVHSYIHTTSNRLMKRMQVFLFGAVSLIIMWCLFFIRMIMQS